MFSSLSLILALACAPKKIEALQTEVALRDQALQAVRAENQGYVVQIATLREEVERLGAKNAELVALYGAITAEFGPELESGAASLVLFPDRTVLGVPDGLRFASGSDEIEAGADLDRLAAFILAHPQRRFAIEGHTDAEPIRSARFASNWELGAARAVAVVEALLDRGVPAWQLSAVSFAETAPVASNAHDAGMAANRRIDLAVELSVRETGAQTALLEAARRAGGPVYALATEPQPEETPRAAQR